MRFAQGGAPTPSENWDDDFDFQPPPPPPNSSSAASSKPRYDQDDRQKTALKGGVVESWDDDFEYDPLDWKKDLENKTGKDGAMPALPSPNLGWVLPRRTLKSDRTQPPTASRPIPQRSSSTLLSTTSTTQSEQKIPPDERSKSSILNDSAAPSNRRDRKRSSDRLLPHSSSSRSDLNTQLPDSRASLSDRIDMPARLPQNTHNKEGAFMRRISSVRRRISSSISIGPSSKNSTVLPDTPSPVDHTLHLAPFQAGTQRPERHGRAVTSVDMPPPPVPMTALRSSSLMVVGVQKEGDTASVSSHPTRTSPEGMPFRLATGTDQGRLRGEPFPGLPNASLTIGRIDRSASAASSREVDHPSVLPSPVLVTPMHSAEASNQANTGVYGFHLPSPSAGSAYNMLTAAPGRRSSYGQASESSSKSDAKYNESVAHVRYRTETDANRTPKANRNYARPVQTPSEVAYRPGLDGDPSRLSIDDQNVRSRSASRTTVESTRTSTDRRDSPVYITRITSRDSRVEVSESRPKVDEPAAKTALIYGSKTPISSKEERVLHNFRFGDSASNDALHKTPDVSVTQQATFETTMSSAIPAPPSTNRKERARLSLQRISSLSHRHSRRISDSWKSISGTAVGERLAKNQSQTDEVGKPIERQGTANDTIRNSRVRDSIPTIHGEMFMSQSPQEFSSKEHVARKPTQLAAALPLFDNQQQAIPVAMRSLSHNDSPTASRFKTLATDQMGIEKAESERGVARRSSLGDLKIPSRVVSAQRGLKEEIGAMKQFAAGIQDLKALMAQHTILRVKQDRSGINDAALELRYATWWSLADLLVQLGETGSLSNANSGSAMDDEDAAIKAKVQRQRRITLAPGTVLPSAHLSALAMDSAAVSLLGEQERVLVTDLGGCLTPISNPIVGHTSQRSLSNIWRASTGRIDFSTAQLEELRGILDQPQLPVINAPLQTVQPNPKPTATSKARLEDGRQTLGTISGPPKALPHQRRASKSNVTVFKDFWRAASGSQRSIGTVNHTTTLSGAGRPALPKSQTRPSLASIFRRSSNKVTTVLVTTPLRVPSDEMKEASPCSSSVLSEKCVSPESSLSDWDSPSEVDALRLPSPHLGGSVNTQHQSNMASLRPGAELTITRSDSRKLLAGLGRGPSPAVDTKPVFSHTKSTDVLSESASSAAAPEAVNVAIDHKAHLSVLLTPASLPPLLAKLNDVTSHCKAHLDVISERLTDVDKRVPRFKLEGLEGYSV
ncbi:hypothetical protein QFC21_004509 [Naganishia friedmannii]|uniref:Uncharacterized protein n=1 Tax=Naganishia friedmannii TaxID=89922 RepID=A0ACC2VGE1_9TREE|nr:hypothetical protein QFC21_004509 [Naganishia friedmannii]